MQIKIRHIVILLIFTSTYGIIDSCCGGDTMGFFAGIASGIFASLLYSLLKNGYKHRFGWIACILRLDILSKFINFILLDCAMFCFNLYWMYDPYGFTRFTATSTALHIAVISIILGISAVCIFVVSWLIWFGIVDWCLEPISSEMKTSVSVTSSLFFVLMNLIMAVVFKIMQAFGKEIWVDLFFIYQVGLVIFACFQIVKLFLSHPLLKRGVKKIWCEGGELSFFILQGNDFLFSNDHKISLKDVGNISMVLRDGQEIKYRKKRIPNGFVWERE